jgi:2-isopropylmalate synthase
MKPESVGIMETQLVLGKHSGRHAVSEHLKKMGYKISQEHLNKVIVRFKELADVKKDIFDEDLEAILYEEIFRAKDKYKLVYLNVVSGNVAVPTAVMQLQIEQEVLLDAGFGVGPVDATFAAIRKITKTDYPLVRYAVDAITKGADALGEATVELKYNGYAVTGRGAHPDVLVASAMAYINALNRLEWIKGNIKKVRMME